MIPNGKGKPCVECNKQIHNQNDCEWSIDRHRKKIFIHKACYEKLIKRA